MGNKAIRMKNSSGDSLYPCPYFPIGSIYMNVTNVNPGDIFGGTWEQIEGRFLIGVGKAKDSKNEEKTFNVGDKGGEYNHQLTEAEMPSHNHDIIKNVPYGIPYNNTSGVHATNSGATMYGESYSPFSIGYRGGNQAHNNLPPYLAVYIWKRIA